MLLQTVQLVHFRNVVERSFAFHSVLTIIIGENARGKTNILESIYLSINGWGFRESKEEELIAWGQERATVETTWGDKGEKNIFTISIVKRGEKIEKHFFVNKTKKTHFHYGQYQIKSVLFAPEHIDIVAGSPDGRRDYFNRLIFTFDPEYRKRLHNYEHALYKRNKVLENHKNIDALKEELVFWNDYLEKHGAYITAKREEYLTYLNSHPSVEGKTFRIEYLQNRFTKENVEKVFEKEIRIRKTQIGPQKDDFQIYLTDKEEKNIHHFGSRSEQRLGVFWLKLNELSYLEEAFKTKPLLLLDDVFSELDTKNKQLILDMIGNYQTILTTTEKELLDLAHIDKSIITL